MKMAVHHDLTNSIEDFRLLDVYEAALRDLMAFYDRVTGASPGGNGWTAADVLRLEQIRMVGAGTVPNGQSRPQETPGKANGSGTTCKTRKARKTRRRA